MYLWLGLRDAKRKTSDFLTDLPQGYEETTETRNAYETPPTQLHYPGGWTEQL